MTLPDGTGEEKPDFSQMSSEEATAWLENLARQEGADEEELTTSADLVVPEPATDAALEGPETTPMAEEGTDELPVADPLAWLESLAERQSVSEEELAAAASLGVPEPSPDVAAEEADYAPYAAFGEGPLPAAELVSEAEPMEPELPSAERVAAAKPTPPKPPDVEPVREVEPTELPAWLTQPQPEEAPEAIAPSPVETAAVPTPAPADEDDTLAWLESLGAERGAGVTDFLIDMGVTPAAPPEVREPEEVVEGAAADAIDFLEKTTAQTGRLSLETVEEEEAPPEAGEPEAAGERAAADVIDFLEKTTAQTGRLSLETVEVEEEEAPPEELPPAMPGELPDWLADRMPAEIAEVEAALAEEPTEEIQLPRDWFETLAEEVEAEQPDFGVSADMPTLALPAEEELPAAEPAELPEWLANLALPAAEEEPAIAEEEAIEAAPKGIAEWLRAQEEAPLAPAPADQEPAAWIEELTIAKAEPEAIPAEPEPLPAAAVEALPEAPAVEMPVAEPVAEAPPAVETAESWLTRARQLQEAEEFEASLDEYARLVRAEQYLNEAAEDLEAIVPQLATNIRVRRLLGDCYMRQDRLQEALDTYRGALSQL